MPKRIVKGFMADSYLVDRPPVQSHAQEFSVWRIEVSEFIEDIKKSLLGYEYDHKIKDWTQTYVPKITKRGAEEIAFRMRRHLNKIQPQTNYTDDDIRLMQKRIEKELVYDLLGHYDDWGLELKELDNIHTTVADNVYATFKRAWNAGERNSIDKPQTERHVYKTEYPAMFAPPTEQQKKGDRKWPLGM